MDEIKELQQVDGTSLFGELRSMGHEQVVFCNDEETGLKSIIGIHDTTLGPSLGGTRMWDYANEHDALIDVLRLSRGMTFKAAITGLNIGGGKAVLIGTTDLKTEAYLKRFGRFIDSQNGWYVTAEDVNMKTRDMEIISTETKYVTGLPESMGGGGDPSPVTAYGTYVGMKAMAKRVYGSDDLQGKTVLVQGVGQVGMNLVKYLTKEGANVHISDLFEDKVQAVATEFGSTVVENEEIFDFEMDIYAPCALGATLNDKTIPRLKCQIVAGAANNQLEDELKHGYMLLDRNIAYAPDFAINAGGLINVYNEFLGSYSRQTTYQMTEGIYNTCNEIQIRSEERNISPQEAAMELAKDRLNKVKQSDK